LMGRDVHNYIIYFLFLMLSILILGSLACMHVLVDAVKRRDVPQIIQMIIVEIFVMFMEVFFFYRELIDSLTPWIVQQTGMQLDWKMTMMLASFGWFGIRGMVWFLFARFGTPTILAIIGRQQLPDEGHAAPAKVVSQQHW